MKKSLYSLLIVLLLGVFGFAAWQLISTVVEYEAGTSAYKGLEQYVSVQSTEAHDSIQRETKPAEEEESPEETEPVFSLADQYGISVDFDALMEINEYTAGWLYIPDTQINYPVVQPYDNLAFLHKLFDGSSNSAGCLFMDELCDGDFSEPNSIIYGHNMRNGSMFADLIKYKKQDYFEAHPEGLLLTPEGSYRIVFFSGYVLKVSGADAWRTSFTEELYEEWLQEIMNRSILDCDIVPETTDRVLTLSTCSYEFTNARFVLHGIILEEGDNRFPVAQAPVDPQ